MSIEVHRLDCHLQALTRMYNQPTTVLPDGRTVGALYKSPIDCLWKTVQTEGIFGWYKGMCATPGDDDES